MRKLLISVAIATATIAAVPAAAQYHGQARAGWHQNGPSRAAVNNLVRDLNRAQNRITRSQQRRIISPREAVSLRREANQIRQRLHFAARGGISGREFAQLRFRVNRLEQRIRLERRDRDRRPG
jgi:hypothetical protein